MIKKGLQISSDLGDLVEEVNGTKIQSKWSDEGKFYSYSLKGRAIVL